MCFPAPYLVLKITATPSPSVASRAQMTRKSSKPNLSSRNLRVYMRKLTDKVLMSMSEVTTMMMSGPRSAARSSPSRGSKEEEDDDDDDGAICASTGDFGLCQKCGSRTESEEGCQCACQENEDERPQGTFFMSAFLPLLLLLLLASARGKRKLARTACWSTAWRREAR
jgi:hypothetical protein